MTLARYLAGRVGQAIFVLWAAFTASFVILYLLPSDPVLTMLSGGGDGTNVDPVALAALRHAYGFDRPVLVQYFSRLGSALHGNFGQSMQNGQDVSVAVLKALPETAKLTACALLIAVLLGSLIASVASYTSRTWLRQLLLSLPPLGVALPSFWIGLILLQAFSFHFAVFPASGNAGWSSLVLPAVTLAVPTSAVIAQVLAKSLSTTWGQPFVEALRAKGLSRLDIHLRHVFVNGAIPALTMLALVIGNLLAGSVVTETVFSRSGVGRLTQNAVQSQDIPLVQGVVVLSAFVFVVVNLLVDLTYPLLDPRIVRTGVRR